MSTMIFALSGLIVGILFLGVVALLISKLPGRAAPWLMLAISTAMVGISVRWFSAAWAFLHLSSQPEQEYLKASSVLATTAIIIPIGCLFFVTSFISILQQAEG